PSVILSLILVVLRRARRAGKGACPDDAVHVMASRAVPAISAAGGHTSASLREASVLPTLHVRSLRAVLALRPTPLPFASLPSPLGGRRPADAPGGRPPTPLSSRGARTAFVRRALAIDALQLPLAGTDRAFDVVAPGAVVGEHVDHQEVRDRGRGLFARMT